jgi:hypothetical protein
MREVISINGWLPLTRSLTASVVVNKAKLQHADNLSL